MRGKKEKETRGVSRSFSGVVPLEREAPNQSVQGALQLLSKRYR